VSSEEELLSRLRDVHPPAEPGWWPPAPGWWLVLLAALALAVIATRYAMPRIRRWRMRRRLLKELDAIALRHRAGSDATTVAADVSQLLRIAALERFPERQAARLHGRDWIAFLEACEPAPGRFDSVRDALTAMPYRPPGTGGDALPLLRAARGWLRAVI
jgi:uncharacterized protein DUF4381